ncbi:hypothetical protein R2Q26_09910 [Nitrosomonas sp. Is37]|nr:hypothetical protein [Nitrosomonas sp. Is37]MDV6344863.1 hypothetical protein [Nitrosomonas sp. Is37]
MPDRLPHATCLYWTSYLRLIPSHCHLAAAGNEQTHRSNHARRNDQTEQFRTICPGNGLAENYLQDQYLMADWYTPGATDKAGNSNSIA